MIEAFQLHESVSFQEFVVPRTWPDEGPGGLVSPLVVIALMGKLAPSVMEVSMLNTTLTFVSLTASSKLLREMHPMLYCDVRAPKAFEVGGKSCTCSLPTVLW